MQDSHPGDPKSNVSKFTGYDPEKYTVSDVSLTVRTDEGLTPGRPPCLTQQTIGKFLQPLTRELSMIPPAPTIDELPEKVIDEMVLKDKAFWVVKPGADAYTLHDAYYNYGLTTEMIKPRKAAFFLYITHGTIEEIIKNCLTIQRKEEETHQDVFPRSYQYDLDCVRYRRTHACDGLKPVPGVKSKPPSPHCRDCRYYMRPGLTPFQLAWAQDAGQKRWRYYPDLTASLTPEEIRNVGRPFHNEACNWYYKNYPSMKYDVIVRKFSK